MPEIRGNWSQTERSAGPGPGSSLREAVRALKAVQQDVEPFFKLIFNDVEYARSEVSQ